MAKIKIQTVKQMADVQVIPVNSSLVFRVARAHLILSNIIAGAKHKKQQYIRDEKDPKNNRWEDVLDANGNNVIEYHSVDGQMIAEDILPLINELAEALRDE